MVAPYKYSQASQLFINCCFALSLTGISWLAYMALLLDYSTNPPKGNHHYLWFLPLVIYLVFVTWRQYSSYFIPLQYYLDREESEGEELTTFLITIVLACLPIVCFYQRRLSLVLLMLLILLNFCKVQQMKRHLPPTKHSEYPLAVLDEFSERLKFYFGTLLLILCPMIYVYLDYVESNDTIASFVFGMAPLFVFGLASRFKNIFLMPERAPDPAKFHKNIRAAFDHTSPERNELLEPKV